MVGFSGIVVSVIWFGIITMMSTVPVSTGYVQVVKGWGDVYTGKVIEKPGLHFYTIPPSYSIEQVDVRNNKLGVSVNLMKNQTYNVSASIEIVYDLEPSKLVTLLSNYSDYNNTVIGATVKQVVTSNNTLANSQSLTPQDEKEITTKLSSYGVNVTSIYMNSYKLTNSSNLGFNGTVNSSSSNNGN
jgi:hypothetical protein